MTNAENNLRDWQEYLEGDEEDLAACQKREDESLRDYEFAKKRTCDAKDALRETQVRIEEWKIKVAKEHEAVHD